MRIIDVPNEEKFIRQIAEVLLDDFTTSRINPWENLEEAVEEVRDSLGENRISRAALDADENVTGWIAGFHEYALVWELHRLVVRADLQNKGIGSALVRDFEKLVKSRGGLTVRLGTDDENNRTNLGGVDLYGDALGKLKQIENLQKHPFEFYRKLGYEITGAIPDANGFGKPDIIMCKQV